MDARKFAQLQAHHPQPQQHSKRGCSKIRVDFIDIYQFEQSRLSDRKKQLPNNPHPKLSKLPKGISGQFKSQSPGFPLSDSINFHTESHPLMDQPLFKPINSAADKYPAKTQNGADLGSTNNQFRQQSEQLKIEHQYSQQQRREGGSVGPRSSNLKAYSNRGSTTRMPSQIINPAAIQSHDATTSLHQRIDESYDGTKAKYKIEYQAGKPGALTRKHSKVNTLVNSLINSTNTGGLMQAAATGQSQKQQTALRTKKVRSSSIQKSLESPMHNDQSKAADLLHGHKVKQNQLRQGTQSDQSQIVVPPPGPKKRFYNSMVVSGIVSESQTPKIVSQSSHHVKEKFSFEDPTTMQHSFNNRGNNALINKQMSTGGGGPASHESRTQAAALAANTPSRRKSRQTSQKVPVGVNQVTQQQYATQGTHTSTTAGQAQQQNVRSLIGSMGQRRRTSKQMSIANSQSQLQTTNISSTTGEYQLNQIGSPVETIQSPQKAGSKLYKQAINRQTNKSYIPINSGTYNMPNGGRSENGSQIENSSTQQQQVQEHSQLGTDANIYEVAPHKHSGVNGTIYNQFVKQGQAKIGNISLQQQQDQYISQQSIGGYCVQIEQQQTPISSYYLLHGKYNAKNSKKQSSSVKATDLANMASQNGQPPGKSSIMVMHQLQQHVGKANPKSHSHGISTPTAINFSATPNQGSLMNVPKHHVIQNAEMQKTQRMLDQSQGTTNMKKGALCETHMINTTTNTTMNRLSEGSHIYGTSDMKSKPSSKSNTKRNSLASNLVHAERSIKNSAQKKGEHQRQVRNSENIRSKQNSRHKRKNATLSSTQQIVSEQQAQTLHKTRTSTNKQGKGHQKRTSNDTKVSERQSTQVMSGELEIAADDPSAHNSTNPRGRGRGLMLQQSVDRPVDKLRIAQCNNQTHLMPSSVATSVMTSPKMANKSDSVTQSHSRRSQGGNANVAKGAGDHHLHQTVPRVGSSERSSMQSPAQSDTTGGAASQGQKMPNSQVQIGTNKLKQYKLQQPEVQSNERYTPSGKDAQASINTCKNDTFQTQRKIITNTTKQTGLGQPRILNKTTKNSAAASKEHLHHRPGVGQAQGQVLINQYVSSKKRGLRRDISAERISSIERTSQAAEKIFMSQQTNQQLQKSQHTANMSCHTNETLSTVQQQKAHYSKQQNLSQKSGGQATTKNQQKSQLFQHLKKANHKQFTTQQLQQYQQQISQSSFESAQNIISPSMMSGGGMTQGSASDSLEALRKLSNYFGGLSGTQGTQGSLVPLDNPLMIQEQEELVQMPDQLSPRSREIAILTKVISNCFKTHNKMPKTRIELYKVGKILGKGAFGKVNLGLHRLTRKLVAIKSTDKDQIKEESTQRKMMQEIDILKSIKHTSHIKLLETFQTNKHYLIVMELCPGGDLLNYVRKRRKLTERNAKYLFKQIMQGIAYMHQIGIVHRDIKLDNILLDGQGNVKIGDFGVSRRVDQGELLFEQCGTPAYIAPEIVHELGYKGCPVDIWSAGVCLYAILYGNVPFKANQIGDLTTELYQQEIEYRDTVSEQSRDLMQSMLEKNVAKRLTAREVLYHPWFDDTEAEVDIFDEQELNLIRKEFTYILQKQKLREQDNRSPHDLNTEFTEHSIGAALDTGLLKNSSTRSIILCPFNSRQADPNEQNRLVEICAPLMEEKDFMIRFGIRVRELDRAYEKFNNQDFDNGVYHKYAYKQQKKNGADEEEKNGSKSSPERSTARQIILQRILKESQTKPERVLTPESEKYAKIDMTVVERVQKYGFPQSTIINSLRKNLANHCTTSYYLLLMQQNF